MQELELDGTTKVSVPIPGYERPLHFPGDMEDAYEHLLRASFQEAKAKKEEHK
jgi:hypothetical protein